METPQAKRLRLAKKYLDEIKKSDDEDEDVSKKLKLDYLESVGKLKKYVADKIVEHDSANIRTLKHRLQNLSITCLCISPDDQFLFSGSKSGVVIKWILKDNKPSGSIQFNSLNDEKKKNSNTSIQCMALSSDFKFMAIGDLSWNIQIWNPDTLAHIHTFEGHRDIVNGLAFRKDTHQLYSCSNDRSVKIWSLDEMTYIETLQVLHFIFISKFLIIFHQLLVSVTKAQSLRLMLCTRKAASLPVDLTNQLEYGKLWMSHSWSTMAISRVLTALDM